MLNHREQKLIKCFLFCLTILVVSLINLITNPLLLQSCNAQSSNGPVDQYGFPIVSGNPTGETKGVFAVSEKGSATYSLELKVPAGTNGMQPNLSLVYDSTGQNSYLGQGWNISGLSAISRCPATAAQDSLIDPVDFDSNDKFCLDGQRLVAVSGVYGANNTEYRTENEIFAKIVSIGTAGSGPSSFQVSMKNGLKYVYNQQIAHDNGSILIWKLSSITDRFGNYFSFQYANNISNGENYPTQILYSGNYPTINPYNSVDFEYEPRPDVVQNFMSGKKMEITQRLKKVKMYVDSQLAWEYRITYQQGGSSNRSQLNSITQCDANNICLQPVQFTWQSGTLYSLTNDQTWGTTLFAPETNQDLRWFVDMNADGKLDFIYRRNATSDYYTKINTGSGTLPETYWGTTQYAIEHNWELEWFVDLNGDGKSDLVYNRNASNQVYVKLSNSTGTGLEADTLWATRNWQVDSAANASASQWFVDLNGDSLPDYLYQRRNTSDYYAMINTGSSFASEVLWGTRPYAVNHSSTALVWLVDINNDSLTDLVYERDGTRETHVMLTKPVGGFDTDQLWGTRNLVAETNDERQWLVDLNADSLPDLIYQTEDHTLRYFALINTGTGFLAEVLWGTRSFETNSDHHGRQWMVDMNGDHLPDLIYQKVQSLDFYVKLTSATGSGFLADQFWGTESFTPVSDPDIAGYNARLWFMDLTGDGLVDHIYQRNNTLEYRMIANSSLTPDLITQINHGQGSVTTINYDSLTNSAVYSVDGGNIYPTLNLIGPMFVVSGYQTSDGVGGMSAVSYFYTGLKTTLTGRGMCGFRQIEITDHSTGIKTKTDYRQDFPYKTLPLQKEVRLSDGTLISKEVNTWNQIQYSAGNYFVYLDQNLKETYDLQGNLLYTANINNDFDSFGNTTTMNITRSDGWNETSTNTYLNDTTNWIIGRLTNSTVTKYSNYVPAQTRNASFSYDATTGVLLTENIEPNDPYLHLTKSYTYDMYGNTLQKTISGSNVTNRVESSTYDARGQFPTSTTNTLGQTATTLYSSVFASVVSMTDANGLVASFEYDGFGRTTYEHKPDGTHKRILYLSDTNMPAGAVYFVRVDESAKAPQITYYDMLDREIEKRVLGFSGQWIVVKTAYNSLGQVAQTSEAFFLGATNILWTTYQYDLLGRQTQMTVPGNRITSTVYNGLTTLVTNPLSQTSQMTKNSLGKTISVTDHLGAQITYGYDNFGNLISVTDPNNNVVSMQYDVRGNKLSLTDSDTGTSTYTYDALGQLISQTDANGNSINFSYDSLGRLTQRNSSNGTASWQFDNMPHAIGKLTASISETGQSQNFSYDNYGRLEQMAVYIPEVNYLGSITRSYDNFGRVDTLVYPTGFSVRNNYNANGYLESVERLDNNQIIWQALTQNARGQLEQFSFGNGLLTNRIFDNTTGYLTDIQAVGVQNLKFTFDPIGNLTQRRDLARNLTENFVYDGLNRLTSSQVVGQAANTVTYDNIGNISSMSNVGNYLYNGSGAHALTSISGLTNHKYSYDLNGNLVESDDSAFAYDAFNKATVVKTPDSYTSSSYDADHNLYLQQTQVYSTGINRTKIYFGGIFEMEEANGVQKMSHYIQAGNAAFAIFEIGTKDKRMLYLHKDHLGSIQSISDDLGNIVEVQSYDSWGNKRDPNTWTQSAPSTSQIDRGFTGHEHMLGTNFVNMGGRIYNPAIGRFLTPDPYVQAPENLQNLNRYSYVLNNPLSYTDPSGFFFKKLWSTIKTIATDPKALAIVAISAFTGVWMAGYVAYAAFGAASLTSATLSVGGFIVSSAAGGFSAGIVNGILNGNSLSETLRGALTSAAMAAVTAGLSRGYDEIMQPIEAKSTALDETIQSKDVVKTQKQYLKLGTTSGKQSIGGNALKFLGGSNSGGGSSYINTNFYDSILPEPTSTTDFLIKNLGTSASVDKISTKFINDGSELMKNSDLFKYSVKKIVGNASSVYSVIQSGAALGKDLTSNLALGDFTADVAGLLGGGMGQSYSLGYTLGSTGVKTFNSYYLVDPFGADVAAEAILDVADKYGLR